MSIVDKIAVAATATSFAIRRDQARAALRAIKPEDVSDGMVKAFAEAYAPPDVITASGPRGERTRRALAAAIAAGAEQ